MSDNPRQSFLSLQNPVLLFITGKLQRYRSWGGLFGLAASLFLVGLLATIIYRDWPTIQQYPWNIDPFFLLASLSISSAGYLLFITSWALIMHRLNAPHNYLFHLKMYSLSNVLRYLPGTYWYIPGRSLLYQQANKRITALAGVIELFFVTVSAIIVYSITLVVNTTTSIEIRSLLLLAALPLGVLSYPPILNWLIIRVARLLHQQFENVMLFEWNQILFIFLINSLVICMGGLSIFFLDRGLVSIPAQAVFNCINSWSALLAISNITFFIPAGFGLRELVLTVGLQPYIPASVAILLSLFLRIWQIGLDLIWFLIALRLRPSM